MKDKNKQMLLGLAIVAVLTVLVAFVVIDNIGGPTDTWQPLPQLPEPPPMQQPTLQQNQPTTVPAPRSAMDMQEGISHAVSRIRPSVVAIFSPDIDKRTGQSGLAYIKPYAGAGQAMGSGIIVDPQGLVLTTFQAVGKAKNVRIRLFSGGRRDFRADVLGVDPHTDLALLKVLGTGPFPIATLGNSDFIETGDIVFAIGSPYGFSRSATMGIISTSRRQLLIDGVNYPNLIQTDAAINDGDDGGPLINVKGEVIGINMAYFVPGKHFSGIGFAVPINEAKEFLTTFTGM